MNHYKKINQKKILYFIFIIIIMYLFLLCLLLYIYYYIIFDYIYEIYIKYVIMYKIILILDIPHYDLVLLVIFFVENQVLVSYIQMAMTEDMEVEYHVFHNVLDFQNIVLLVIHQLLL